MINKKIAVLIPVYNDWDSLMLSINSIDESIDLDLVIVNDGSDRTETVKNLSKKYINGEVYLIDLQLNKGIEYALNKGLEFINSKKCYKFIARLDCGDICISNRFKIQSEYLISNPEITLVGSQVQYFNKEGLNLYQSSLPLEYVDIKKGFYFNCQIIHPTVMFKIDVIDQLGYYPTNYPAAEDYAYFFEIIKNFKAVNLNKILLNVLISEKGISAVRRKRQVLSKIQIQIHYYYLGFHPTIGIIRNLILYFIPRRGVTLIRKMLS